MLWILKSPKCCSLPVKNVSVRIALESTMNKALTSLVRVSVCDCFQFINRRFGLKKSRVQFINRRNHMVVHVDNQLRRLAPPSSKKLQISCLGELLSSSFYYSYDTFLSTSSIKPTNMIGF